MTNHGTIKTTTIGDLIATMPDEQRAEFEAAGRSIHEIPPEVIEANRHLLQPPAGVLQHVFAAPPVTAADIVDELERRGHLPRRNER